MKKLILLFWLLLTSLSFAGDYLHLHSHNDYLHDDYPSNALAHRYESLEVDVRSWRGDIRVSH